MIKQHGRPADPAGRTEKELAVYDRLDALGIDYDRVDHPAAHTMEDCLAIDRTLGAPICKNLFLTNRQKTQFYLLLMPGDKPFRTKELSAQIQSARLSFAGEEELLRYLNVTPGAATVLGLLQEGAAAVRLLIDRDLLKQERIGCHPLVNTASVGFSMQALFETLLPASGHAPTYVTLTGED